MEHKPVRFTGVRITVMDPAGKLIDDFNLPAEARSLSSSFDAHWVAYASGGKVYLRDTVRKKSEPIAGAGAALLSSDAKVLAVVSGGRVAVHDLSHRSEVASFKETGTVSQLAFSDDHQRLGLVCGDQVGYRVLLYDLASKQITYEAPADSKPLIAFRPGERTLTVVGPAGDVASVDDDPLRVAGAICKETGRSLSPDRWSQLLGREPWVDTCAEVSKSLRSSPAAR